MYTLTSEVTRSGGRNVNAGHFISYVFTEDEIIIYDDKTVKRKIDENLSSNSKFQREVCAVTYCLDLGVIRLESLKTLYYKKWVHSEAMNATFIFISKERYGVTALSFIVMNNTGES